MKLQDEIDSLLNGRAILPDHTIYKFLIHFWVDADTILHAIVRGKGLTLQQYRCLAAIQYAASVPNYPEEKWNAFIDEVEEWFGSDFPPGNVLEDNEEPMFIPPQVEEDVLVPYIIVGINI